MIDGQVDKKAGAERKGENRGRQMEKKMITRQIVRKKIYADR